LVVDWRLFGGAKTARDVRRQGRPRIRRRSELPDADDGINPLSTPQ
jgi:hypothetical protein